VTEAANHSIRLATIRTAAGTRAVRIVGDEAVELDAGDVRDVLTRPDWRTSTAAATGPRHDIATLDYAPLVGAPEKIVCVGLNYRSHILEMGHTLPEYPTLFAKYSRALIGAHDPIVLPKASGKIDWEAELGVVIGAPVRDATAEQARAAIAGYTVVNDVTARDWQGRTAQWLQGKTFEACTPIGPWLVVADPADAVLDAGITCSVDGEIVQEARTGDLVFDPVALVQYISQVITLVPGDVIATGTPGGVGHARTPPRYLVDGAEMVTSIDGIGTCRNTCRASG
jgi:acylpyruvate hydrolase